MWAVSERHAAIADMLIKAGADIHARSSRGSTALMFAAQQGDLASARLLLAAGADANAVMAGSRLTPVLIASAMGREDVATLLLDHRADPNAIDGEGFTSLHHAAIRKDAVGIVKQLLAHGADPDIRLRQEKPTAITENGVVLAGATPLALAAEINNLGAVTALVEAGADINIATEQNTTPLILAAGGGTDLARPRPNEERATALLTARFLIERGADVNAAGQFGWTALHAATYQGLNDVIRYLAGQGAKLDAMDGFGQTALSISQALITKGLGDQYYQAPRIFRRDTADLLLALGATPLERSGVVIVTQRATE
jgi:ankyrin repeat protein